MRLWIIINIKNYNIPSKFITKTPRTGSIKSHSIANVHILTFITNFLLTINFLIPNYWVDLWSNYLNGRQCRHLQFWSRICFFLQLKWKYWIEKKLLKLRIRQKYTQFRSIHPFWFPSRNLVFTTFLSKLCWLKNKHISYF